MSIIISCKTYSRMWSKKWVWWLFLRKLISPTLALFSLFKHAPGVPKILIGNRLHLAYKRQVSSEEAQIYAIKNDMEYFEVSSLCDYNVTESLTELSRVVLNRNGMERLWRTNKGKRRGNQGGCLGKLSVRSCECGHSTFILSSLDSVWAQLSLFPHGSSLWKYSREVSSWS